jgi:hypothetical protein
MSIATTFQKEISFIDPSFFNLEANKGMGAHEEKEVKKTATFKELSRTDKDQRKFQFMLMSVFKSKGEGELQIDHDMLCDITEKGVDVLLIPDTTFTEIDKTNFLNDNGAVITFGLWLLAEKISPFFSLLIPK